MVARGERGVVGPLAVGAVAPGGVRRDEAELAVDHDAPHAESCGVEKKGKNKRHFQLF